MASTVGPIGPVMYLLAGALRRDDAATNFLIVSLRGQNNAPLVEAATAASRADANLNIWVQDGLGRDGLHPVLGALAEATARKTIAVFDNHILLGPASEVPHLRGWLIAVMRERFDPAWALDAAGNPALPGAPVFRSRRV